MHYFRVKMACDCINFHLSRLTTMKQAPAFALLLLSLTVQLHSQTEEQKLALRSALGTETGDALLTTHSAINALGEGWANKTFGEAEALDLATSYRGSAELCFGLIEAQGNSPARQTFAEGAALLVKQAVALEAWVKLGDDALEPTYEKFRLAASATLFPNVSVPGSTATAPTLTDTALPPNPPVAPEQAPEDGQIIALEISESKLPSGSAGPLGKMNVTKVQEEKIMEVRWDYQGGVSESGWGVAIPNTGKMAACFGTGISSIGLYQLDLGKVKGREGNTQAGAPLRETSMTQEAETFKYAIDGGGDLTLALKENGMAEVTWTFPDRTASGIGIADGAFLAVISCAPDAQAGVALYSTSADGSGATSRWTTTGLPGLGTETLKILSVTPVPSATPATPATPNLTSTTPAPAAPSLSSPLDKVRAIAEELRLDLGSAAPYRPDAAQVAALAATPGDALKLQAYVDLVYAELILGQAAAKEGQTEILVSGPDLTDLPGGYSKHAEHFKSDARFYRFKYVKPGEDLGMSFDGLTQVNGKWIFIPKAWRAFEEVETQEAPRKGAGTTPKLPKETILP